MPEKFGSEPTLQEIQSAFSQIEVEAIATKGIDAEDNLDTDAEIGKVHDSRSERAQGTSTDCCVIKGNEANLNGRRGNADNPIAPLLLETQ